MRNLSLRAKLLGVLAMLSAVAITIAIIGITRLASINESLNLLVDVTSTKQLLSNQMRATLLGMSAGEKSFILAQCEDDMDRYAKTLVDLEKTLEEQKDKLARLMSEAERSMIAEFDEAFAGYKQVQGKVFENSLKNTNAIAGELSKGKGRELFDRGQVLIRSMAERYTSMVNEVIGALGRASESEEVRAQLAAVEQAARRAILINRVAEDFVDLQRAEQSLILERTADGMAGFAREVDARHALMLQRLAEIETGATEESKRDIAGLKTALGEWMNNHKRVTELSLENSNEVARMVSATEGRVSMDALEAVLNKISEDSDRDMIEASQATDQLYATARMLMIGASVGGIGAGLVLAFLVIRGLVLTLRRTVNELAEGATQVHEAADQVSQASQQLAEGASEQASSLEETSSALEELAATTRANASNATQADELSNRASAAALQGDRTMRQLNEAMTAINASSDQISKIIKVIEEIAFQTNLLALNAAVEAARAGEHGKGFAVVADEVRNLAQRAAQAARETTTLIEDSVNRAREGSQIAGDAGKALDAIVSDVQKVNNLINGIAQASQDQAQGVDQINTAVSQMDKVTQVNASSAEEAASASEELSAQAAATKAVVDQLITLVEGRTQSVAPGRGTELRTARHRAQVVRPRRRMPRIRDAANKNPGRASFTPEALPSDDGAMPDAQMAEF